jgi:hypothetical protein
MRASQLQPPANVSNVPDYVHEALDPTKDEIRVLREWRIDDQRIFSSRLVKRSLPSNQHVSASAPYIALSYAWGPASPTKTILLNGQSMAVRLKHQLRTFGAEPGSPATTALPTFS